MELPFALGQGLVAASPALLPALSVTYSLISSPHCAVMCAPLNTTVNMKAYFVARLLSYSAAGALLGLFGKTVFSWTGYQWFSVLGYVSFVLLALLILSRSLWPKKLMMRLHSIAGRSAVWRGGLTALLPCHSLYFFYSVAALSGSVWAGALIMFGHAVVTMPALAWGRLWLSKPSSSRWNYTLKALVIILSLSQLLYFSTRTTIAEPTRQAKTYPICF